jgi:hypothetical protein
MLGVDRIGDLRCSSILAQDFCGKREPRRKNHTPARRRGEEEEVFCFCFSSLAESVFAAARTEHLEYR